MTWSIGPGWSMTSTPPGSVSFNGTSQYISAPNNAVFAFGATTTAFTIEFWMYATALPATSAMLYDPRPASTQGLYPVIYLASDGSIRFFVSSADRINSGAGTITTGKWYHIALTRNSTLQTLFINGRQTVGGYAAGNTYVTSVPNIGAGYNGTAAITSFFTGYISNLRVVNGQNVYVSLFAVPTQPLTATQPQGPTWSLGNPVTTYSTLTGGGGVNGAVGIDAITGTQTVLLLNTPNTANFLTDTSINGFTITNNGAATAASLSPFAGGAASGAWQAQSVGDPGSLQFGQGVAANQYFRVPYSAIFDFGSGDFTVELWALKNSTTATERMIAASNTATTVSPSWSMESSTTSFSFSFSTAGTTVTTTTLTAPGTSGITVANGYWYHLAAVRSGSVFSLYINGVLAASSTNAITLQTPNAVTVGARQTTATPVFTNYYNGLISNLRVVKGVAVYTGNFTPATQQLPPTQSANTYGNPSTAITGTQTSLLLTTPNNEDVDVDSSTNALVLTAGNYTTYPVAYNASNPFVTGFTAYTGVAVTNQGSVSGGSNSAGGKYLTTAVGAFAFLTNATVDWTVETWFATGTAPGTIRYILGNTITVGNSGINLGATTSALVLNIAAAGGVAYTLTLSAAVTWILNQWYHVAITYKQSTNTVTMYLNGTSVASGSPTASSATASTLAFFLLNGGTSSSTTYWPGPITNSRVVNGVVVYTGNFTVPTAPLTATQSAGSNISAITGTQTTLLVNAPYITSQCAADSSPGNNGDLNQARSGAVYSLAQSPFIT